MANKYPPFVNAYGKISELFSKIKEAAVPPKFTMDFLHTVLGLKSSSYRAMIPFLKRLEFLDQDNVPTQVYKDYRGEDSVSKIVLANQVRKAFNDLFKANEYAYKLSKTEINSKLRTLLGVANNDVNVPAISSTFLELIKLSDFEGDSGGIIKSSKEENYEEEPKTDSYQYPPPDSRQYPPQPPTNGKEDLRFGISYTINLNLPATTEIEVFNAIFKSLKENLLK